MGERKWDWMIINYNRKMIIFTLLLIYIQITGCQKEMESPPISHTDMYEGIDYDYIEKNHKILTHNICTDPQYDYENTILKEYLEEDVERDKEMAEKVEIVATLEIDYFTFDFNADGLDDYLVCYHGYLWGGSKGNTVRIFAQNKDGTLKEILNLVVRLEEPNMPNGHAPLAVLKEKTAGFYAIVLPGSNRILRYDKKTERYEFHDNE